MPRMSWGTSGEVSWGTLHGTRWPGHVHRGALSGPPVRTPADRSRTRGVRPPRRRPAGSRGGNPLRDMGSALSVDPWGDRRRGVSRFPGRIRPRPAPVTVPAMPYRPEHGPRPEPRPPLDPAPHRRMPVRPGTPNRPGRRAPWRARHAGRRQSAGGAGWCGWCGCRRRGGTTGTTGPTAAPVSRVRRRALRVRRHAAHSLIAPYQCDRPPVKARVSGPRPGRSRGGPHPCRSGAGGRCGIPAP